MKMEDFKVVWCNYTNSWVIYYKEDSIECYFDTAETYSEAIEILKDYIKSL